MGEEIHRAIAARFAEELRERGAEVLETALERTSARAELARERGGDRAAVIEQALDGAPEILALRAVERRPRRSVLERGHERRVDCRIAARHRLVEEHRAEHERALVRLAHRLATENLAVERARRERTVAERDRLRSEALAERVAESLNDRREEKLHDGAGGAHARFDDEAGRRVLGLDQTERGEGTRALEVCAPGAERVADRGRRAGGVVDDPEGPDARIATARERRAAVGDARSAIQELDHRSVVAPGFGDVGEQRVERSAARHERRLERRHHPGRAARRGRGRGRGGEGVRGFGGDDRRVHGSSWGSGSLPHDNTLCTPHASPADSWNPTR